MAHSIIRTALLTATVLAQTACATQATLAPLHDAQLNCTAGNNEACTTVPMLQANADAEANHNGWMTAAAIVLLPLYILVAAAGADADDGYHHHHWHR